MLYIKQILFLLTLVFTEILQAESDIVIPGYSPHNGWISNQKTHVDINTDIKIPYDDAPIFFTKAINRYTKWNKHEVNSYITYRLDSTYTFTDKTKISFLMYSKKDTKTKINLVIRSDAKHYLRHQIDMNWVGWKLFTLEHDDFISSSKNKKINVKSLNLITNGWRTKPSNLNEIIISDIRIHKKTLDYKINYTLKHTDKSIIYTHYINIRNLLNKPIELKIDNTSFINPYLSRRASHNKIKLTAYENKTINISTEIAYDTYKPLTKVELGLTLSYEDRYISSKSYNLASPLTQTTSKLKTIINDNDIGDIIKGRESKEWIREISGNIKKYADNINQGFYEKYGVGTLSPPITEGEWGMRYIAKDGSKINIKPESFNNYTWLHCTDRNRCIQSGTLDKVINGRIHNDLAIGAFRLGLAYKLYGNESYAEKAGAIINDYISNYLKYPLHGINKETTYNQARIHSQNFEEARWLIYLMLAYDLIKENKSISITTHKNLSEKLIHPSIKLLDKSGAPNQAAWNLAAKIISGYLIDDPILVYNSLYEKNGFISLLEENITRSGEWKEGSWSYFFYAIEPILLITESSWRRGIDLYSNEIGKLLASPTKQILPDGSLPSFGDTRNKIYPAYYNYIFRIAQERYNNDKLSATPSNNIKDTFSLLWTYDVDPPIKKNNTLENKNEYSDTIILRNSSNFGNKYVALKHSSNTPHSHLDNLSYIYSSDAKEYLIDPGTTMYSDVLASRFYNQSIAHNTVTINELSHTPSKGRELLSFNSPKLSLLHAESKHAYNNIGMRRFIVLRPEYFIDIFDIDSHEGKITIDLSIHSPLIETDKLSEITSLFRNDTPHKYLRDISSKKVNNDFNYTIIPYSTYKKQLDHSSALHATLIGAENTTAIKASYKPPTRDKNSVIVIRREAQYTSFTTLYQHKNKNPEGAELKITSKNINNGEGTLITIENKDFIDHHYFWNKNIKNEQQTQYTFYRRNLDVNLSELMIAGLHKSTVEGIEIDATSYEKYLYFDFNNMTRTIDIQTHNPNKISVTIKPKRKDLYENININGRSAKTTKSANAIKIDSYITR